MRMVTNIKRYIGLSTDLKPTTDTPYGSSLFEEDTGKFFYYDKEEGWVEKDPDMILRGGALVSKTHDQGALEKLGDVLTELKIMNLYLSSMSEEIFSAGDVL